MPFDASGNFTRVHNWQSDRDNGIRIMADRHDEEDDNFAEGLNETFLRNGLVPMTGNLVMNGFRVLDVDSGTASAPGLTFELDPDTGFFQPGAGQIGLSINGVQKILWTDTGATLTSNINMSGPAYTDNQIGFSVNAEHYALDTLNVPSYGLAFAAPFPSLGGALSPGVSLSGYGGLLFGTAGLERMRINGNGRIGIGTTTPRGTLSIDLAGSDVPTTPASVNTIVMGESTHAIGYHMSMGMFYGGGSWSGSIDTVANSLPAALWINSTGGPLYVGGPLYPQAKVTFKPDVHHDIGGQHFFSGNGANGNFLYTGTTSLAFCNQTDGILGCLTSAGRMGLGTTNPRSRLTVLGESPDPTTPAGIRAFYIGESTDHPAYHLRMGMFINSGAWQGSIQQISGDVPSTLCINPEGGPVTVGIVTPQANGKITVNGGRIYCTAGGEVFQHCFRHDAGSGFMYLGAGPGAQPYTAFYNTAGAEQFRAEHDGAMRFGYPAQMGWLERYTFYTAGNQNGAVFKSENYNNSAIIINHGYTFSGSAAAISFFNYNGVGVGSITMTAAATAYNTTSDERLKENIAEAETAGPIIDTIKARKFDWKDGGAHQRYGFVAQELVEVFPEAVYAPEDPEQFMAVDYSKLVPLLVKEIQELRTRVAALEGAR